MHIGGFVRQSHVGECDVCDGKYVVGGLVLGGVEAVVDEIHWASVDPGKQPLVLVVPTGGRYVAGGLGDVHLESVDPG